HDLLDPISFRGPLLAVLLTVAVVIVARFVWVFPAIYLPRRLSPKLARRDPAPPWQWVFFLAFVGVRGVVSRAAPLAIPLIPLAGAHGVPWRGHQCRACTHQEREQQQQGRKPLIRDS